MTYKEIYSKLQGSIDATLPPVKLQEPKTDTWSIKDVADTLAKHGLIVEQEPKTGHWIAVENEEMETIGYYCSECDLPMETENQTRFCPNCGAKMSEIPTDCSNLDSCENCKYDDGECCRLLYEAQMESEDKE